MINSIIVFMGILSITYPVLPPADSQDMTPLEIFSFDADYGAQRCATSHCTCRVIIPTIAPETTTSTLSSIDSLYFTESSAQITQSHREKVSQYLASKPNQRYFTVIGYTDGCGGNSYNYGLAMRRATAVRSLILSLRSNSTVSVRAIAELSEGHDTRAIKVDIQSQTLATSFPQYPEIIADVYLIDVSGSMGSEYRRWLRAIYHSMPRGSTVYISYTGMCRAGQNAITITPGGGTEIWYSYWHILDIMSRGQTLAIISDFNSSVPITPGERVRIRQKVSQKGVRVIAITP